MKRGTQLKLEEVERVLDSFVYVGSNEVEIKLSEMRLLYSLVGYRKELQNRIEQNRMARNREANIKIIGKKTKDKKLYCLTERGAFLRTYIYNRQRRA